MFELDSTLMFDAKVFHSIKSYTEQSDLHAN